MGEIAAFVDWMNESMGLDSWEEDLSRSFGAEMTHSLGRQFSGEKGGAAIRMSSLGKPTVLQALAQLGYKEHQPKGKLKLIFLTGDFYEAFVGAALEAYGFEILDAQGELDYKGVKGHFDFVVKNGKEAHLLEVKTMSPGYSRIFRQRPDDARGYVTQLAVYRHCLSGIPASWVCLDKGTGLSFTVSPDEHAAAYALGRVDVILPKFRALKSVEQILEEFSAPPPKDEIYRRQSTGRKVLDDSILYSPFAECFYKIEEGFNDYGKPRKYVVGMKDTEEMVQSLVGLVASGKVRYG